MVKQIAVLAMVTDCKNLQSVIKLKIGDDTFLQSVTKLFTVGDKTYIGIHRIVPVSFITDCKVSSPNVSFYSW